MLDLGCGDGTTALPTAKLGTDVLGVDIASNLVDAGNKRAKQEGLTNCRFQEGDATNLSELGDHSFDTHYGATSEAELRFKVPNPDCEDLTLKLWLDIIDEVNASGRS